MRININTPKTTEYCLQGDIARAGNRGVRVSDSQCTDLEESSWTIHLIA